MEGIRKLGTLWFTLIFSVVVFSTTASIYFSESKGESNYLQQDTSARASHVVLYCFAINYAMSIGPPTPSEKLLPFKLARIEKEKVSSQMSSQDDTYEGIWMISVLLGPSFIRNLQSNLK